MRKIALVALAVVAAAGRLALGLLASCAKPAPKTVTVYMWSEYIDPELLERFEKETGLKVVLDTYENTETMMSKVASASDQYDVVVMSDHAVRTLSGKGTFRAAGPGEDPEREERHGPVPQARLRSRGASRACPTSGARWASCTARTSCRTSSPPGWPCFDPDRQPGPVVLLDSMRDLVGAALIAQGPLAQHAQRGRARGRGRPARRRPHEAPGRLLRQPRQRGQGARRRRLDRRGLQRRRGVAARRQHRLRGPRRGHDHLGRRDDHPREGPESRRRAPVHQLHPRRRGRRAALQLPRLRHAQRGEPAADRRGDPRGRARVSRRRPRWRACRCSRTCSRPPRCTTRSGRA